MDNIEIILKMNVDDDTRKLNGISISSNHILDTVQLFWVFSLVVEYLSQDLEKEVGKIRLSNIDGNRPKLQVLEGGKARGRKGE
ncbi:MAG: hypothetical protein FH758_06330 [Firmicutes bacterium]|nr:hypothetical protein [Bacillota bacterium]